MYKDSCCTLNIIYIETFVNCFNIFVIYLQFVYLRVVWLVKSEDERGVFADISPTGDGVFRLAKQMDRTNQDVVGDKCVRNDAGELSLSDEDKMKAWVEAWLGLPGF